MNARSLASPSRLLSLGDRWLIVSLGILLGLFASACAAPAPHAAGAPAHAAGSPDPIHAPSQEYRS